jgi:scyllo-inositol 2-dehydrogenase (NADP+)
MSSRPITTALFSYGMSGEIFHAPFLSIHKGFQLKTVVERSQDKVRHRYPDVKSVKDKKEILTDASIELVVVNTPNETHFPFVKEALEAGKHVIVEKPFTVTSKEADDLIALAKSKNKILTVFQSRRFDGDFRTLQKVITEGMVGKIAEFEAHYDRFRNYIEPNTWKEELKPGTGILYNLGSHMLDQVMVLFGMPKEVYARVGIQRPGGSVDDYYDIRLTYDGFFAIVKSSYLVREQGPRYILHGVEGSFIKYGIDPQEQDLKDGKMPGGADWGKEDKAWWGKINSTIKGIHVEEKIETLKGDYLDFYQNVYDAIRENKSLVVKPEEARDVIRLIELCYESNKLKQTIKLS